MASSTGGSQTAPLSLIIFGAIFAGFGLFFQNQPSPIGGILLTVGIAIAVLGLVWLVVRLVRR